MDGNKMLEITKELQYIRKTETASGYIGGWIGFVISLFTFANMLAYPPQEHHLPPYLWWIPTMLYTLVIVMLFDSFFIIIKHILNRRIILIMEMILAENRKL